MGKRDLAIEGLRPGRGLTVMGQRAGIVAHRLKAAAFPILGAGLADGARDAAIQLPEVGQRCLRVLQKAQGDEAGQKLLVGILVAAGETGMADQGHRLCRVARR